MHLSSRLIASFLLFCLYFTDAPNAQAALGTKWTRKFPSNPITSYAVQFTRFDAGANVIVAGFISEGPTGQDLFVAKLAAADGQVLWSWRKNGTQNRNDKLSAIALAPNGDVFVAGALVNDVSAASGQEFTDAYLARIGGADGLAQWESVIGPKPGVDEIWRGLALDQAGDPVVTGMADSSNPQTGSDMATAKFDGGKGTPIWVQFFSAFSEPAVDSGHRVFVDPTGEVYVQGAHPAQTIGGVALPPSLEFARYGPDGVVRFAVRSVGDPALTAFGFLPAPGGGFIVGAFYQLPGSTFSTYNLARGDGADGNLVLERNIGPFAATPVLSQAQNGDVLVAGAVPPVPPGNFTQLFSARLQPIELIPGWTQTTSAPGNAFGFAHVDNGDGSSVLAGIAPGLGSPDLYVARLAGADGKTMDEAFVDGGNVGNEIPPAGPALDTDKKGGLVAGFLNVAAGGARDVVIARLAPANPPTVMLTFPSAADPNVMAGQQVLLAADASDPDGDPVSVEFIVDGEPVGTVTAPPYQLPFTFTAPGNYTVQAVATDSTNLTAATPELNVLAQTSTPVTVAVTGAAQRTGPSAGRFNGSVSNLAFNGVAVFEYGPVGVFDQGGGVGALGAAVAPFTTAPVALSPSGPAQPVEAPFTFAQPHVTLEYRLKVTFNNGPAIVTSLGQVVAFTIPNAPVIAGADVFFASKGPITGRPLLNDNDDDAGEQLNFTIPDGTSLGKLTTTADRVTFVPGPDFSGEAVLQYVVDDGFGSSVTQQITVRTGRFYTGRYRALTPPDAPTPGCVDAVISPTGAVTLAIRVGAERLAARGVLEQLDAVRVGFTAELRGADKTSPDRTLFFALDPALGAHATLGEGDSLIFNATGPVLGRQPLAEPELYTLRGAHINPGGDNGGRVPAIATARLLPNGNATIRGRLGDGSPFIATGAYRTDLLPIYAPLSGRRGSFLQGRLVPTSDSLTAESPGLVAVQATGSSRVPAYAQNYQDHVALAGPLYTVTKTSPPPLNFTAEPRQLRIVASGPDFPGLQVDLEVLSSNGNSFYSITGVNRVNVNGLTGEFTGAFRVPGRRGLVNFNGVLRPAENQGLGLFRGPTAPGGITVLPQ